MVAAANVTVLPGAICPKCTTLTPLLEESYDAATGAVVAVAGKPTQLLITPYNGHGNVANASAADMFAVGVTAGQLPGSRLLGAASNATVLQVCAPSSHICCYQQLLCVSHRMNIAASHQWLRSTQVAALTQRQDGRLLATVNPSLAGRFVISAAYLSVLGEPVTFARLPITVSPGRKSHAYASSHRCASSGNAVRDLRCHIVLPQSRINIMESPSYTCDLVAAESDVCSKADPLSLPLLYSRPRLVQQQYYPGPEFHSRQQR